MFRSQLLLWPDFFKPGEIFSRNALRSEFLFYSDSAFNPCAGRLASDECALDMLNQTDEVQFSDWKKDAHCSHRAAECFIRRLFLCSDS